MVISAQVVQAGMVVTTVEPSSVMQNLDSLRERWVTQVVFTAALVRMGLGDLKAPPSPVVSHTTSGIQKRIQATTPAAPTLVRLAIFWL